MVYAGTSLAARTSLWGDIHAISLLTSSPWLVGGDFNAMTSALEKKGGGTPNFRLINNFNDFVRNSELCELPFVGCPFTWSRGNLQERLDRAFVNNLWMQTFPISSIHHLSRTASDHAPLLLLIPNDPPSCPKPFRFQNMWTLHSDFYSFCSSHWPSVTHDNPIIGFWLKHKYMASKLKSWNWEVFGNIHSSILDAEHKAQSIETDFGMDKASACDVLKAQSDLADLINKQAAFMSQKVAGKFLLEGDRNTKFFHAILKRTRQINHIARVTSSSGLCLEDPLEIASDASQFFQHLYAFMPSSPPTDTPTLFASHLNHFSSLDLTSCPSAEDVFEILNTIDDNKTAGPDGFSSSFYKVCWPFLKEDIVAVLSQVFKGNPLHKFFKTINIALIPKNNGKSNWDGFRPISLTSTISKLVSKIVVSKIQPFLDSFICSNQTGFVKGRQITDNILLTQELLLDLDKNCYGGNVMIKLDIQKAYDTLSWDFLKAILRQVGFSPDNILVIHNIIAANFHSVLVNGGKAGFFESFRGLKQGDPLSPYLFIIAMDYLSRKLNQLSLSKKAYLYSHKSDVNISHLAFADDIIIFCNASKPSLSALWKLLSSFEKVSGMFFNKAKCQMFFGKHVPTSRIHWAHRLTGFSQGSLPISYLGVNLSKGYKKCHLFEGLIDKVQARINSWENHFLSYGGKVTLLHSVLSSLPIYTMQTLKLPSTIRHKLEGLFNKFLWQSKDAKIHWKSWKSLCKPKDKGGLGFKSLEEAMQANFIKLWIKFRQQDSLWAKYMAGKYCKRKSPFIVSPQPSDSVCWKELLKIRDTAQDFLTWDLGEGSINFWFDKWHNLDFSKVYGPFNINTPVSSCWSNFEWDVEKLDVHLSDTLINNICQIPIAHLNKDCPHVSGDSTCSLSKAIFLKISNPSSYPSWEAKVWNNICKPTQSFLLWRILHNILPVDNVLKLKGIRLASICHCCFKNEESLDHLFMHCPVAKRVWLGLENILGVKFNLASFHNIAELISHYSKSDNKLYVAVGCFAIWHMWLLRNNSKHNGSSPFVPVVVNRICQVLNMLFEARILTRNADGVIVTNQFIKPKSVSWSPPLSGWLKLNVAVCFAADKNTGVGLLFRNSKGHCKLFAATSCLAETIVEAALRSVCLAVILCNLFNLNHVIIESDCHNIFDIFKLNGKYEWNVAYLVRNVRNYSAGLVLDWSYTCAAGNRAASFLASVEKEPEDFIVDHILPPSLKALVFGDNSPYPNFVL